MVPEDQVPVQIHIPDTNSNSNPCGGQLFHSWLEAPQEQVDPLGQKSWKQEHFTDPNDIVH